MKNKALYAWGERQWKKLPKPKKTVSLYPPSITKPYKSFAKIVSNIPKNKHIKINLTKYKYNAKVSNRVIGKTKINSVRPIKERSKMNKIQKVSTEVQSFIAYLGIELAFAYSGYMYFGSYAGAVVTAIAGLVAVSKIKSKLQ